MRSGPGKKNGRDQPFAGDRLPAGDDGSSTATLAANDAARLSAVMTSRLRGTREKPRLDRKQRSIERPADEANPDQGCEHVGRSQRLRGGHQPIAEPHRIRRDLHCDRDDQRDSGRKPQSHEHTRKGGGDDDLATRWATVSRSTRATSISLGAICPIACSVRIIIGKKQAKATIAISIR